MAKAKYTGLDYYSEETVLDGATAIKQAAQALDVAAQNAVECRDGEILTTVAALWLKMAESLETEAEEEEEKPVGPDKSGLGFTIKVDREEEDEADDGDSGSQLYPQPKGL